MRNEYNIALIPAITRAEYISALEQAHKNNDVFYEFIADRVIMTQLEMLRLFREMHPDKETKPIVPFEEILHQAIVSNPGLNAPKLAELLHRSLRTTQRYLKVLTTDKRISFRGVAKKGGYFAEG